MNRHIVSCPNRINKATKTVLSLSAFAICSENQTNTSSHSHSMHLQFKMKFFMCCTRSRIPAAHTLYYTSHRIDQFAQHVYLFSRSEVKVYFQFNCFMCA